MFQDYNDTEAQQFMETDIDQILERISWTVTYGSYGQSTTSSGLGNFSTAGFVSSTEDGSGQDVDLDNPDFWEKSVGLEAPYESIGEDEMKVIFENRSRNQVKVYYPYTDFDEVFPEPVILLFSGGTDLNGIIRSF